MALEDRTIKPEGKSIEENKATKFHPYWEWKQDLQWVALEFNWIFQVLGICSAMQPASRPWRSKASSTQKLFHLCSLKFFQPVCKSAIPNENEVYRIDAEGVAIIDLSPFDGLQLPNGGLPLAFYSIQFRYFVMGHVMQSCRHTPIQNSKAILGGGKSRKTKVWDSWFYVIFIWIFLLWNKIWTLQIRSLQPHDAGWVARQASHPIQRFCKLQL